MPLSSLRATAPTAQTTGICKRNNGATIKNNEAQNETCHWKSELNRTEHQSRVIDNF